MISVTFNKGDGGCWVCGMKTKGFNTLSVNAFAVDFCSPCLIDLQQEIVQKCCDTEYSDVKEVGES